MVIPSSLFILFNKAKISFVVLGSKADVASSHKRILGFNARALAIATLCFCPPLNCAGLLFILSSKSTNFNNSNTLFFILSLSYPHTSNGNAIFLYTVFLFNKLKF